MLRTSCFVVSFVLAVHPNPNQANYTVRFDGSSPTITLNRKLALSIKAEGSRLWGVGFSCFGFRSPGLMYPSVS